MYHWVAWHRELARKIAEGGRDDLVEKIEQVADKVPEQALGPVELGKDPLSFFDFLRNSQSKSNEVCEAAQDVFGLEAELPDPGELRDIIFPSVNASLVGDGDLLWRLFEQAVEAVEDNHQIDQKDWRDALYIDGVEVSTLTQALFLVNPDFFLPMDSAVDVCFSEAWRKEKEEKINGDEGYAEYLSAQEEIKKRFPECKPYEIWTFLRWQEDKGVVNEDSKFFQVSTNAHGDGRDFWDKDDSSDEYIKDNNFKENNWAFVGGPGGGIRMGWERVEKESLSWEDIKNAIKKENPTGNPYPLYDPKRGDIILVRYGNRNGKGIGVILENDYNKSDGSGLREKGKIHVLWINKSQSPIAGTRSPALIHARSKTCESFANEKDYKSSFELISQLTGKTTIGSGEQVNQDHQQARASTVKHHLNTILYGPPGTGKTYDTVNYAVAIVEGKPVEDIKKERGEEDKEEGKEKGYKGVKERFDGYRKEKQIEMVTFHQNYAYEDFIEGIRPVLKEDGAGKGEVKYKLRKGVFREISDQAAENMKKAESGTWDIDELLSAFAISIQKELESGREIKLSDTDDENKNILIEKVDLEKSRFWLGGSVKSDTYTLVKDTIMRDYNSFCKGEINSPEDIRPAQESESDKHGMSQYYYPLYKKIKQFHADRQKVKNYVLIIDEINRGNIAKIFGELITLIEESRRLGRSEATEVTLPYSGKSFGVPNNLYIIGTMNTADRSIALLDTALRRRFEFKEMMPDPELLPDTSTNIDGVNCRDLLKAMNERIRVLLDREHQIGHTYFLDVEDIESLKKAFQNKIIPLLQEYFYDNWEKIDLVLNQNGKGFPDEKGFIKSESIDEFVDSDRFKKSELIDKQRKIYEILPENDPEWDEPKNYINIYTDSKKAQNTEQNESGNAG